MLKIQDLLQNLNQASSILTTLEFVELVLSLFCRLVLIKAEMSYHLKSH